ncbi:extracellular solute-binding protein [Rivularia sp. UHCC 0363]|uniref:extracellular solute-binding protein n=1 Tax=Rivularia sp. UHCC 0363 TaxID=3110244 RepID=UPI002B1FC3BF|nr:extracellular solute-binding protein [Rivularia sp. UHCC 0363]MEA5597429.1 extracellular solute-binding protein [Rivularia sp. UHCC 0363]
MLNRRSLLLAAGLFGLNQLLGGCRASDQGLRVRVLAQSVPAQILQEFQRRLQVERADAADAAAGLEAVRFVVSPQLADLFKLLQTWKNPPAPARIQLPGTDRPLPVDDLTLLGDYWLAAAIQQNLIQPLPLETLSGWQQLPTAMQQLVRRDRQGQLSPTGEIWGAPYRWSSLVIAYNVERFERLGWQPTDWADLWRPELRRQISLPDSARATLGLTLKKLGQSANLSNLDQAPTLAAELEQLQQQVKFYSSTDYLQPLLLGDSWLAVGWSSEVLPLADRDRRIAAVAPASGSLLSADLWVRPAAQAVENQAAENQAGTSVSLNPSLNPSLTQWLEFCWQPDIAAQISLLSSAASPVILANRAQLSNALQQRTVLLPPPEVIDRSEFLLPLSDAESYRRLWVKMRQ